MDSENNELIWVPKKFAEQYKAINSNAEKEILLDKYIKGLSDQAQREFQSMLECIEEDVVRYKALLLKAKAAFDSAADASLSASYNAWEKYDKQRGELAKKVDSMTKLLNPLESSLSAVIAQLKTIETYPLERVIELIGRFNSLSDESKNMLMFLLNNYKKGDN